MNQMTIMGHLGNDPEVRFTSSGQKVTTLRVAANQKRGGKAETFWWRVTLWGEQFDKLMPYLKKGSAVIVMGEMQKPEIYNDREGRPQVSLNLTAFNISFSPFGRSSDRENNQAPSQAGSESDGGGLGSFDSAKEQFGQGQGPHDHAPAFSEDEIPF